MEEEDIRKLFKDFNPPEIKEDYVFFNNLQSKLDTIEIVKKRTAENIKTSRRAAWTAAAVGFISGIIFTIFFPGIVGIFNSLYSEWTIDFDLSTRGIVFLSLITTLLIGALCLTFVTYCTYTFAVSNQMED